MPKAKARPTLGRVRASVKRLRNEGEHVVSRLRRDAQKLIARSQAEVLKDMRAVRSEVKQRTDRAVRDLERKVVKRFHAATEEQVRRLERRIVKLEQTITGLIRKPAAGEQAA